MFVVISSNLYMLDHIFFPAGGGGSSYITGLLLSLSGVVSQRNLRGCLLSYHPQKVPKQNLSPSFHVAHFYFSGQFLIRPNSFILKCSLSTYYFRALKYNSETSWTLY